MPLQANLQHTWLPIPWSKAARTSCETHKLFGECPPRYTPPARIGAAGEAKDRREHEADKSSEPVERGRDRDVLHTLAIDPDLAAVAQPGAIFFLGSDHACLSAKSRLTV